MGSDVTVVAATAADCAESSLEPNTPLTDDNKEPNAPTLTADGAGIKDNRFDFCR